MNEVSFHSCCALIHSSISKFLSRTPIAEHCLTKHISLFIQENPKMVCHGPDPPDNAPHDITPPSRPDLLMNGPQADESDEEVNEHFGYEPLPLGPDTAQSDPDSDDDNENVDTDNQEPPPGGLPTIVPMEQVLTREVWNAPRPNDPIQMDSERAQQVMSAMANFALPSTAIPDWAQSITEDQWKQTLADRIEKMKTNR